MLIVISWRCFTPSHFGIVHDLMVVAASSALDLTNCIMTSWLFFFIIWKKRHIAYNLKHFLAKKKIYPFHRFKEKAKRISGLLRDHSQTPLQEACNWIEYTLRHGGAKHLKAQVFKVPWYQYYLLDVIAFLLAVATVTLIVIGLICRFLCRMCCKKGDGKTKKD